MEDNLPGVLDGIDEPVTVEQLEEVVRRAGQRRRATLVAGAAGLLALGALGGAIARGPSNDQPLGFAGRDEAEKGQTGQMGQSAQGWANDMPLGGTPEKFVPLFRREANGVAVRAYRVALPPPPPGVDPACAGPTGFVQAELSTAAAVGLLFAPEPADTPKPQGAELNVLAADSFGVSEGEPATSAVVRSGPGVATVRITTPAGTDTMAPQDGIAVLAVGGLADGGTVEGLGPNGAVVASQPIIRPPSSVEEAVANKAMAAKGCSPSACVEAYSAAEEPPVPLPVPPPVTTIVESGSTGKLVDPGPNRIEIDPACSKVIGGSGGVIHGPDGPSTPPSEPAVAGPTSAVAPSAAP